jgi:hypothetical protein
MSQHNSGYGRKTSNNLLRNCVPQESEWEPSGFVAQNCRAKIFDADVIAYKLATIILPQYRARDSFIIIQYQLPGLLWRRGGDCKLALEQLPEIVAVLGIEAQRQPKVSEVPLKFRAIL